MFYLLKVFFKDPWVFVPLAISALAQVFMWPYIFFNLGTQGGTLFLHYNIIFGVDYVGEWWRILIMPVVGLAFVIINFIAGIYTFNSDKLLSRILTVFTAVLELFLALAVYLIVDINL
ncbi:MAG: hypothetical protein WC457_02895 [Patescibacteria group bacterium]